VRSRRLAQVGPIAGEAPLAVVRADRGCTGLRSRPRLVVLGGGHVWAEYGPAARHTLRCCLDHSASRLRTLDRIGVADDRLGEQPVLNRAAWCNADFYRAVLTPEAGRNAGDEDLVRR